MEIVAGIGILLVGFFFLNRWFITFRNISLRQTPVSVLLSIQMGLNRHFNKVIPNRAVIFIDPVEIWRSSNPGEDPIIAGIYTPWRWSGATVADIVKVFQETSITSPIRQTNDGRYFVLLTFKSNPYEGFFVTFFHTEEDNTGTILGIGVQSVNPKDVTWLN
jgi:hypothetical protein